jgi:hypothetical protein
MVNVMLEISENQFHQFHLCSEPAPRKGATKFDLIRFIRGLSLRGSAL